MNDTMRLLPRAVHFPFCRNRSYLFHKAIIKGSVDRVNGVGVNVKKHGTNYKAIPHNSKCRHGERGAAAAKPKAQAILCAAKVSAASGGYSEPKQGQRSQSARDFCPRSTMRVPQPDIGEHFGNADAVPHTEPQRGASERNRRFAAALGAEIRRSGA